MAFPAEQVATFRCRGELRDSALAWADEDGVIGF